MAQDADASDERDDSTPDAAVAAYARAIEALGPSGLTAGQIDGLLAAVLVAPEAVPQELWLSALWILEDGNPEPEIDPESPEAIAAFRAVMMRCGEIALDLDNGDLKPLFDLDVDGSEFWETWADGFKIGMTLCMDAWIEKLEARSGFGDAARLMVTLIELGGSKVEVDEVIQEIGAERAEFLVSNAPDLLIECVLAMMAGKPRARGAKVGRNDPCPCGSGRKFKKCCGAG